MSFNKWPKRSAEKNYFMVPNEIFSIGLDFREISLYSYLLRCENRKTYQCYPSYKTIGHAIGMSENTVAKYVRQLEEKGLIYTEPTIMQSKDGKPLNGNLLYTIRPIPGVLEAFYERQFRQAEEAAARYRAAQLLEKSNAQGRQNALCAPFREEASPSPDQGIEAGCEPFSADFCRTKEKAGYDDGDFAMSISDNMAMDSDGGLMMRMGDHMAMDMDTGDIHMISSWSDDDEE